MLEQFLVVDDQEADQLLAEYAIKDYNPSAVINRAYDGAEALEILSQGIRVDVILLDINMPGMNGHEFLAAFPVDSVDAPVVVMLTSSAQKQDREKCEQYKVVIDYLTKPLEEDDLREIESKVASH